MEEFITGYQWSPEDNRFIGEYKFPNNKDKEEIHLPPFTTLTKPDTCCEDELQYWDGKKWIIEKDPSYDKSHPPIDDYEMLMQDYIKYLKDSKKWTEYDEDEYQKAIARKEERIRQEEEREKNRDYWRELRSIRNFLLEKTDWTQLIDVQNILTEEEKKKWDTYRQKLRDFPETVTDPKEVVLNTTNSQWSYWPTPPIS